MKRALILATAIVAADPAQALTECDNWTINGELTIRRSDGGAVHALLTQTSGRVTGLAWEGPRQPDSAAAVDGRVTEDGLRLRIDWPAGPQVYDGGIYPGGEMDGVATTDRTRARITWMAVQPAQCADW